jgi:hypothetical protein
MSRKYISQVDNQNFVFPNNTVSEYDVDIIHDINDNCVSGSVINFTVTGRTSTGMTINFDYIWDLNGATPFVRNSNAVSVLSLHMMAPQQNYYKPFLCVGRFVFSDIPITRIESGVTPGFSRLSFVVTPSMVGLTTFTDGTYYFEIKFIGERCVFPVCFSQSLIAPTPTPTSTPTPTPTPTTTVTVTPTPTPTGGKSLEIYARDIDGTPSTLTLFYSKNGGGAINVPGATATTLPSSCSSIYTITGLNTGDSIVFGTSIACVMNGNGSSSTCPFSSGIDTTFTYVIDAPTTQQVALTVDSGTIPAPSPTATPTSTPTPTPTATPSGDCYCYDIVVTGTTSGEGSIASIEYNDCFGVLTVRAFTIGPGTYKQCIQRVGGVIQYFSATGIDESYITGVGNGNCNTGYVCTGYTPSVTPTPTPTATSTPTATPTSTPTPTPTAGPSCVTSVSFDVDTAGTVTYYNCCGDPITNFYGIGPQVINACITNNSVFGSGAVISNITYGSTSCSCVTPTPTATPTSTPTPTPTPGAVTEFTGCGRGVDEAAACGDAANNRTFYSDCDSGSFGVGCYVYIDTFPNPLTGYNNVFMNGATWDINSSTGQITAYSSEQC